MASVTSRTANWRLFGGSAILVASILWIIALLLPGLNWLLALALLILAAGLVIVAFGQTGGNGAVGKYVLGKVALVLFAAGYVLLAINALYPLPSIALVLAGLLIIIAGLVSAWAIHHKAVAKGAARWILFIPAVVGAIVYLGLVSANLAVAPWITYVLAITWGITGALYLLNDRKIG